MLKGRTVNRNEEIVLSSNSTDNPIIAQNIKIIGSTITVLSSCDETMRIKSLDESSTLIVPSEEETILRTREDDTKVAPLIEDQSSKVIADEYVTS